jgi:DNA-binding MarR family transcriptional regulator
MIIDTANLPAEMAASTLVALCHLAEHGPTSPTELAKLCKISTAGMTGLVDRLEKKGHAMRCRVPGDRRATDVAITHRGRQLVESLRPEPVEHGAKGKEQGEDLAA